MKAFKIKTDIQGKSLSGDKIYDLLRRAILLQFMLGWLYTEI